MANAANIHIPKSSLKTGPHSLTDDMQTLHGRISCMAVYFNKVLTY